LTLFQITLEIGISIHQNIKKCVPGVAAYVGRSFQPFIESNSTTQKTGCFAAKIARKIKKQTTPIIVMVEPGKDNI